MMPSLAPAVPVTRVLLVEDSAADAVLVREMLAGPDAEGLEVVHATSLREACAWLDREAMACVLLDLSLPDGEGLDAVARLQTVAPQVPIVVLTGHDDEDLALDAVQEGAQDYLTKGRVDDRLIARSIRYAIERKRADVQLAHQALHDPLTGLPNRTLFLDRLELALARARRSPGAIAVLFLDIDRFKVINDSLGHDSGDRLLMEAAARLQSALRPGDTVARFGGDEFTVLCDDVDGEREAVSIAERLANAIAAPIGLEETEAFVTASVGIALSSGPATRPEALIRDADAAMYRAKERGKARYELFEEGVRARAVERLETENALHRAIERGELRVHYQPVVDLRDGGIRGLEALVRWDHPSRGLLAPGAFVPLAEETGQIVELGRWVLHEACRDAARWRRHRRLDLAVNLSAHQLLDADLVGSVRTALDESGLGPTDLCLEITESAVMEDVEGAQSVLRALREHEVRIGIDDFGTGYASLSGLRQLPADVLKVDRSFVAGLGTGGQDRAIVSAVLGMADALGLVTIAEGVETPQQAAQLRAIGCRYAQGFHFARPLPPDRVEELLS
jgi:diguanylate cyclase (GGDEF)-like protein